MIYKSKQKMSFWEHAMKINWIRKRFTIMIVPDANRDVVRFRVHSVFFYVVPALIALLAVLTVALYLMQLEKNGANSRLKEMIAGQSKMFDETVSEKDAQIERLQNELVELAEQAKQVEGKMDELKKLESELKSLAGEGGASVTSRAEPRAPTLQQGGVGGTSLPPTDADIGQLIDETKSRYDNIDEQMDELLGSLPETKQKLLAMQAKLRATPTIWPVDSRNITSDFGLRTDPFTKKPSFHDGIDIGANTGDPVYAAADGVVREAGWDGASGNHIVISHATGLRTHYMHLSRILVKKGQSVQKGEKIGLVGSTGRSTGPHLHYGVEQNGKLINPLPYLQASQGGK
jgi:murein DD-endopeptidase MepM/ murein hydrolase activator NlpD